MQFVEVTEKNADLSIKLQAILFPKEKSPKQVIKGIKTGNPKNFIAYVDDKPVGIVGYYYDENIPNHIFINWFGVLPEYRQRGYGSLIINWLINLCKNLKGDYLTTYTDKVENSASVGLYKKLGFDVRDYKNQDDIGKFTKLGIENNYVVCCYKLSPCKDIDFENLYLKVYDDLIEMEN